MKCVEVEGTSIDEAIEKALQILGVGREKVQVDILASPTKGLLGIGSRKAKVRVTVRELAQFDDDIAPATSREAVVSSPEREPPAPRSAPVPPAPPAPIDPELTTRAQAMLQDILDHMGFAVSVRASESEGLITLAIDGDSSGVLIGRHGQTLDALEYFLHRALSRPNANGRSAEFAHICVDCEQYRVRRRETLEAMARRLAEQAKSKRKSLTIEALSPRERRIVHLALQNEPGLNTRSTGDGYYRNLLIIPEGARPPRPTSDRSRSGRPPRAGSRTGNA